MSSSRHASSRIWRGVESQRARTAVFTVDLPDRDRGPASGVHRSPGGGPGTPSVLERIEEARADGLRQGYEAGYEAAVAELAAGADAERRSEVAKLLEAVRSAVDAVALWRAQAVAVAETEVVALAIELAEALLRRELSLSSSAGTDALKRALELAPAGEDLVVRLNPEDAASPVELAALVPDRRVRVVVDPEVERGGCVVDIGPCHIDTQAGPALERARQVLGQLAQCENPANRADGVLDPAGEVLNAPADGVLDPAGEVLDPADEERTAAAVEEAA